jgi:hypothetical protein
MYCAHLPKIDRFVMLLNILSLFSNILFFKLSLTGLDFTRESRVMFTRHSRSMFTSHDRSMFTTHRHPVFTTVA